MRTRSGPRTLVLAGLLVGASGCREELGPERFVIAGVSGVILNSGTPATGGWVEFQPAEGAVGDFRSARIGPDGAFQADRVAVGVNVVRIVDLPGLPAGGAAVLAYDSPIRRTIPKVPGRPLRIDVIEELLLYQKAKTDVAPAASPREEPRP